MRSAQVLGAALALTLGGAATLGAQVITDRDDASLAGATVIDFSGQPIGDYTSFTLSNVVFSAAIGSQQVRVGSPADWGTSDQFGTVGQHLANDRGRTSGFLFSFIDPVKAFGFVHGAADTDWSLSAFDANDNLLFTTVAAPTNASELGGFVGLASSRADIKYATYTHGANDWVLLDDFHFSVGDVSSVPEPGSVALLGTGLLGLGMAYRRRQARRAA